MIATGRLSGKRAAMVVFSHYLMDPRPRRAAEALASEGMAVDLICILDGKSERRRERVNGVDIRRVPITRRRGGVVGYVYQYVAFLVVAAAIVAARSVRRRYDLVYAHNMPDILVLTGLIPKLFGAKVILDLHDPMPELMMTIFGRQPESLFVRTLKRLERASIRMADRAVTVNRACQKIFSSRSCRPEKIRVIMNTPDDKIFGFRPASVSSADAATPAPFVIMYHGSLVERNGLDLAVDALAQIRPTIPTAELHVYGSSTPFLERVMASVRGRGLDDAVRYLGPKRPEDIARAIEGCDVGVIPNHRNIFTELNTPVRIFEYLASGKPVIAPRAAGILDYFDDHSLVFFELGDAQDLAKQLEYVFTHREEVADIVARGQHVYRAHTWPEERRVLIDLTDELLGQRRRVA